MSGQVAASGPFLDLGQVQSDPPTMSPARIRPFQKQLGLFASHDGCGEIQRSAHAVLSRRPFNP